MKYCANPQCAGENDDDANFCVYCRTPFNQTAAPASPALEGAEDAGGIDANSAEDPFRVISQQLSQLASLQKTLEGAVTDQQNTVAMLCEKITGVEGQMSDLSHQFDSKVSRNEYEATILKNMSDEIQQYRDDLYEKLTLPLIRELIEARNAIGFIQRRHGGANSTDPSITPAELEAVRDMLSDSLARNDVQPERTKRGDAVLSFKHRIVGEVPTSDEALYGTVAAVANESYRKGEKYISPALVKVYVPEKPAE